jgi:hypothetical protein
MILNCIFKLNWRNHSSKIAAVLIHFSFLGRRDVTSTIAVCICVFIFRFSMKRARVFGLECVLNCQIHDGDDDSDAHHDASDADGICQ